MKLDLKEWISKITALFGSAFIVKTFTFYYNGTINNYPMLPTVAGYTPIGLVGWQAAGSTNATVQMFDATVRPSTNDMLISNGVPTSGTYVILQILYIKTILWGGYCIAVFSRLTGVLRHRKAVA